MKHIERRPRSQSSTDHNQYLRISKIMQRSESLKLQASEIPLSLSSFLCQSLLSCEATHADGRNRRGESSDWEEALQKDN